MRRVVSNASPLIFASKVEGILEILKKLYDKIFLPEQVYREVVKKGLDSNEKKVRRNARKLKEIIKNKRFVRVKVGEKKQREGLGKGENAAIDLAKEKGINKILIDERKGTRVAKSEGLDPKTLTYIILRAQREGTISKPKAKRILDELLVENYWLSSLNYRKIIKELE